MSNNSVFAITKTDTAISAKSYPSKKLADQLAPKAIIVTGEASLLASALKGPDLIALHNSLSEKQISKFESRIAGVRRVFSVLVTKAPKASIPEGLEEKAPAPSAVGKALPKRGPTELAKGSEGVHSKEAAKEAKAAEREAAKAAKAASKEAKAGGGIPGGGRASNFAGKMFRANPELTENPRREGTFGHVSMGVIMAAKAAISFEDYVKGGGRAMDLRWDLEKGNAVEVK